MFLGNNLLELETTQVLLRYVSECDPRGQENGKGTTKGGYLKGRVNVPFQGSSLLMRLDLVPTDDVVEKMRKAHPHLSDQAVMAHPNIIHNIRFRNGKRNCHLEPVPFNHSTQLEYMIDQGSYIRICNRTSELDWNVRPEVPANERANGAIVGQLERNLEGQFFFNMGKKEEENEKKKATNKNMKRDQHNEINLIPLQPKQKSRAKADEANITDVLRNRLSKEDEQFLDDIMKFYSNGKWGKNAINLKNFRLRVKFFDYKTGCPLGEDISDNIKDTGNKNNGSMDIFDVGNQKSCCKGGRKIIITSEWTLAVKEVEPRLQVYDANDNHIKEETERLNQPTDEKAVKKLPVIRNMFINFLSPEQDYETVHSIQNEKGLTIKLLLYRKSDDSESPKKFNFTYIQHKSNSCFYCDYKVDSDAPENLAEGQPRAQPNRKKRELPGSRDANAKKTRIQRSPGYCLTPSPASEFGNSVTNTSPQHSVTSHCDSDGSMVTSSALAQCLEYDSDGSLLFSPNVPVPNLFESTLAETTSMDQRKNVYNYEENNRANLLDSNCTAQVIPYNITWDLNLNGMTENDPNTEESAFPETSSYVGSVLRDSNVHRVSVIVNPDNDNNSDILEELHTPVVEVGEDPFMGFQPIGVFVNEHMGHDGAKMVRKEEPDVEEEEEKDAVEELEKSKQEKEEDTDQVNNNYLGTEMMVCVQLLMMAMLMLLVLSSIIPGVLFASSTVLAGVLSLMYAGSYYNTNSVRNPTIKTKSDQ